MRLCRRQPITQGAQIRDQPIKVRHLRQFRPITQEKHHEVRAKLRVRLGHLMPGQGHHRLNRALDDGQRGIIDPKDHRHNRPPPAGAEIGSILAGEQGLHLIGGHHALLQPAALGSMPRWAENIKRKASIFCARQHPAHPRGAAPDPGVFRKAQILERLLPSMRHKYPTWLARGAQPSKSSP